MHGRTMGELDICACMGRHNRSPHYSPTLNQLLHHTHPTPHPLDCTLLSDRCCRWRCCCCCYPSNADGRPLQVGTEEHRKHMPALGASRDKHREQAETNIGGKQRHASRSQQGNDSHAASGRLKQQPVHCRQAQGQNTLESTKTPINHSEPSAFTNLAMCMDRRVSCSPACSTLLPPHLPCLITSPASSPPLPACFPSLRLPACLTPACPPCLPTFPPSHSQVLLVCQ